MTRRPLTKSDLYSDTDYLLRLSDIARITGWHRDTIMRDVERGELVGFQFAKKRGSPWVFERASVAAWLKRKKGLSLAS